MFLGLSISHSIFFFNRRIKVQWLDVLLLPPSRTAGCLLPPSSSFAATQAAAPRAPTLPRQARVSPELRLPLVFLVLWLGGNNSTPLECEHTVGSDTKYMRVLFEMQEFSKKTAKEF